MHLTPLEQRIHAALAPSLGAMGYGLVLVSLDGGAGRKTLRILAERTDGRGMSVADCEAVSHRASALLDVDDPIETAYDLEVSSPGMDRPLTSPGDFRRFQGRQVKVETQLAVDGRKRFKGAIGQVKGDTEFTLEMPEGPVVLAFENIRSAKLAPTDEDYKNALKQRKEEA